MSSVDYERERDVRVVARDLNVLQDPGLDRLDDGGASGHEPFQERLVPALVSGRQFLLPELALSAGLSHLRLATEGHVALQDYAEAVALTLAALARRRIVVSRA